LRLIRVKIMDLALGNLQPNDVKELNAETIFSLLKM
jgi:16S rRNA U516 pseudouridylate synthase RsuA-like enzyme